MTLDFNSSSKFQS